MVDLADEQNDYAPSNDGDAGADARAKQPMNPPAVPSSSNSAARQAQLAQLKELQAKLDEQRQQTQELCAALEQQHTARGTHAQAAGRCCPGAHPGRRQRRQNSGTANGRRKTRRCGLPTPSHARAIDAFGPQPAPRGTGAHRASCRAAGREFCVSHVLKSREFSLSRLACIPYYKHPGCKIIQCPRTPPLLDVRPRGRNQDKTVCYCVASYIIIWDEETRSIY